MSDNVNDPWIASEAELIVRREKSKAGGRAFMVSMINLGVGRL
jgi:hypothetical protein